MKLKSALLPFCLLVALPSLAAARGLDVRDLQKLDRVASPVLSPDGSTVLFAKRVVDADVTKGSSSLWFRNLLTRDMGPPKRLTPEGWNVNSPAFSPDGKTVYFLSGKSGIQQLYALPLAGGTPRQLTAFALDIASYKLSPDGTRVLFSADTFADCKADFACTQKKLDATAAKKSTGVVYDGLFVRHWDTWADGRRSRLFVAALPGAKAKAVSTATSLTDRLDGDAPSKPFGGADEYTWSPDGASVVASVRVADKGEAWSTNFDLYKIAADGGSAPVNLTAANPAWDTGPVFSADGKTLFYRAMKRPGFEADRYGLMSMDLDNGKVREIAPNWDRSADSIVLSEDGQRIYTTAQDIGEHPLFSVDIQSGQARKIVGDGSVSAFDMVGKTLVLSRNTLKSGDVIYATSDDVGTTLRAITPSADEVLKDVSFGDFEQFNFKGWNNETVHGYVVKPHDYVEGKKYPVAFLIHGGPQGSFGNGWSYRWNPQTYAGQGYAVVMIDFHGSTGYGQAFTDAISQHWGDRPLEDLQKGWAAAQKQYAFLDGKNACALGASYGGYMINWIAGNWNEPWKCLVNHDGVFDIRSMAYVTEELWFTEWENGGTPYDVPKNIEKFNPVNHIAKWRVPMLVVQGEKDYRVPVDQGLSTFTALQRKGIESKLLYFPDENHWVLKPQNSILWHDTVNAWLKQHIGR
ncbi:MULTISPECIES: S9 family peptidase [unclassified Pseudoxanthomonas]|uniref:alpha/beta hydrolase family protein n=1 Tax=unclassified Pseudoxanthomonas TaxID=2645906 RepID=UPI0008E767F2|nr:MULTISPECIES: S9 family peptidase [unclassified Pseudoxanthomonas]PPJ43477.1 S9 family peptidase [Pseudoxanthomonas sp. KAs_5_3]SFV35403.1 Dipeptidyl aminopeptidase/acylaminoacyl peptidase [Pseudoxanthomonas sp. YR558]